MQSIYNKLKFEFQIFNKLKYKNLHNFKLTVLKYWNSYNFNL